MVEPVNHDMILGELRGQVRELVHSVNNLNLKVESMTREVIALGPFAGQIAKLENEVEALKAQRNILTGAKLLLIFIVQTAIAASAALGGVFALRGHG